MTYSCDLFKNRVGYKGQKYAVVFKDEDGQDRVFGWQNDKEGGLANAAALHPGWTDVRVVRVRICPRCECVIDEDGCGCDPPGA